MTSDRGFAPNPYAGILTLATCKPYIRKHCAVEGQWLAGFTSKSLCPDTGDDVKLIYLAKITGALPMEKYWNAYPEKRNCPSPDNIYRKQNGKWDLIDDSIHKPKNKKTDLSGENVITSSDYYYFGQKALPLCERLRSKVHIPIGAAPYGWLTIGSDADAFIEWVKGEAQKMPLIKKQPHIFGEPHGQVVLSKNAKPTISCNHRGSRLPRKGCL